MTNRFGAAGRNGLNPRACVAFLDHYTAPDPRGRKRVNGHVLNSTQQRAIRRWRNGDVESVSPAAFMRLLHELEFTVPWFHKWCKMHRYGPTAVD